MRAELQRAKEEIARRDREDLARRAILDDEVAGSAGHAEPSTPFSGGGKAKAPMEASPTHAARGGSSGGAGGADGV